MNKIKVLVASNAFKGSMGPRQATATIVEGMSGFGSLTVEAFPIADGGDGTLDVLVNYFKGNYFTTKVSDPLGRSISAKWGLINEDTAIIEMANASGIKLLKNSELDPLKTNTYGTGQLILKAVEKGCRKIVLCIGGSATVDGGTGVLKAFGTKFYNTNGQEIESGNYLMHLDRIDISNSLPELKNVAFTILSDVDNPLLGDRGACRVFGPQKGASTEKVEELEKAMERYKHLAVELAKEDFSQMEGAGAAGGIAFSLKSFYDAEVTRGFDFLLKETDLESGIERCDILITGEGKIDLQTLEGKGPGRIAALAKKHGKFCIGICGVYEWHEKMNSYFDFLLPINGGEPFTEATLKKNSENLKRAANQLGHMIATVAARKVR